MKQSLLNCQSLNTCSLHAINNGMDRMQTQAEGSLQNHKGTEFLAELVEGLRADRAYISPKYFYDPLGSKLFETICELPEYYPTRTEASIFDRHAADIAASVGSGTTLIDLGAGNCAKAAKLIPLLKPQQYVPVDISAEFLEDAARGLRFTFPALDVQVVAADFSSALRLPQSVRADKRLFFFPGSSIGNFTPAESVRFLRQLRHQLGDNGGGGGLLLGVDMVKDAAVLEAAYNDALGVTAAFNRNMLLHVNRLLGADFDLADWRHRAFYNSDAQRMDMYLEAIHDVAVSWFGGGGGQSGSRHFNANEWLHTESSHKYTPDNVRTMLRQAGFTLANVWFDSSKWFMICHAKPI